MEKKCIAVLSGGVSSEREVSLNGGSQVVNALDKEKYHVLTFDPKTDIPHIVANAHKIDVALIILHGPYGEDGTVQGLLDLLGIPYQGSGIIGSALAMNKLASKQMYEKCGLPIPPYIALNKKDKISVDNIVLRLGLPLVVKPVSGGSSVGMSIVKTDAEIEKAIEKAFLHDETILLETYIKGKELTGGVIGNNDLEALPIIEIIPDQDHEFFDYDAKYTPGKTQEICPARIDENITHTAQTYAKMAHQALYCKGYSRTDMILQGKDIYVLETNTIPGMTITSLLPLAAKTAGISFSQLLDKLIMLSLEEKNKTGNDK